ncbi:MAG: matrixin family metalloprotease, partial [Myxococcota bacterium]
ERTDTGYDPEGKDNINLVVWRFEGWSQPPLDYPKSALAITTNVFYDKTGEVVKSDIEVNGEDYEWKVVEGPDKDHMDIQNTMTHEAGHVLGLGHSDDPNAVMYYSVKPGETSKRVLAQDDIDGVCAIYPKGVHPDAGAPDSGPQPDKPGGCSCSNAGL